ncbi:MAG: alanine dehydrogenase [Candidatus Omnitrophica bacterium]|nr:alanine dehydrogenase [Candidatus Omnitrophota bacterium]
MVIGIPKEIKDNENRVGMIPVGVEELVKRGHRVLIEKDGGLGSSISNEDYQSFGAELVNSHTDVFADSDMIIKVKEPLPQEYGLIKEGQIIFTYFHFAASKELTLGMMDRKAVCIAYETIEDGQGRLPLLIPMSEVAGRMAVQEGAKYFEKPMGGRGILLGGVPGVAPANVVILGGGIVGTNAAKMAAGMGAKVTILDVDLDRLRYLDDIMPKNVTTLMSNSHNIREKLKETDLLIGAVLISGAKAPVLVTKDMLKLMKPGSVLVDVAVDQGGCIETCHPTTHSNPVFIVEGIVHYCVANMPGAVAVTSTYALTNVTLPYAIHIADKGWQKAVEKDKGLAKGLNIVDGKIILKPVADTFGL